MRLLAKLLVSKYTGKIGNKCAWAFIEYVVERTGTKKDDMLLAEVKKSLGL